MLRNHLQLCVVKGKDGSASEPLGMPLGGNPDPLVIRAPVFQGWRQGTNPSIHDNHRRRHLVATVRTAIAIASPGVNLPFLPG